MSDANTEFVWVFNGLGGRFPSAVFSTLEKAEDWIAKTGCQGILTQYPLDVSAYEWCIAQGDFRPESPEQTDAVFIQRFSHSSLEHYHYENETEDGIE